VVEHKPETIAIADHVVDLGPKAGSEGGEVMYEGSVEGLRESDTITGRHLDDRASLKDSVREPRDKLEVRGANMNNLRDVDVDIPLGVLVVLTGVAGSGKSSLIRGSVEDREGVVTVDQGAIRGSRRSNPATYTGLLDPIRKAFARPTASSRGCSAPTRRAPARRATARASSTPTSGSWPASPRPARSAGESGSRRRCSSTPSAGATSPRCWRCR
jgi:excinuclease UvrABC ATPase subunit